MRDLSFPKDGIKSSVNTDELKIEYHLCEYAGMIRVRNDAALDLSISVRRYNFAWAEDVPLTCDYPTEYESQYFLCKMEGQLDEERRAFSSGAPRIKGETIDGDLCYRVEYGAWKVNVSLILDIIIGMVGIERGLVAALRAATTWAVTSES